jgi:hypothetical protein
MVTNRIRKLKRSEGIHQHASGTGPLPVLINAALEESPFRSVRSLASAVKDLPTGVWRHLYSSGYVLRRLHVIRDTLPDFAATRESLHRQGFTGVLLCDNCSSHIDEGIKQLLADNNIRLVTCPPHTSDLF